MLRLKTLGSVLLERDGEPLGGAARQRRVLALMSLLATAGDSGVTRDRALGVLWSDSDPDRARQALTQALYHARRAVGVDNLFASDGDLRLNSAVITSDVADFEAAIAAGDLDRAQELYGGPFLDAFYVSGASEFERWTATERERLSAAYAGVLDQLAERDTSRGDVEAAVAWRRKRAVLDPYDSRTALSLMTALAAAGNAAGAIEHARIHELLLRQELEATVDPSVTELANLLRDRPDALVRTERTQMQIAPPPAETLAPLSPDRGGTLAGRSMTQAHLPDTAELLQRAAIVDDDSPARPAVTGGDDTAGAMSSARAGWWPTARMRRARRWGVALALATSATVAIVALGRRSATPVPAPKAPSPPHPDVVVAPFRVEGADPALAYLREGMVDLLVTKLTEDDPTRAADASAVVGAFRRAGLAARLESSADDALTVARRLGAGRLVLGSIVGTPRHVVVSGTLLDTEFGRVRAQATVEGPADSLTRLVDQFATRLLAKDAGVWEQLSRHTSANAAALRAYLQGQVAYRGGGYQRATREFQRALDRDPGFALAGIGLVRAAARVRAQTAEARGLAAAWNARDELTDRDRAYLDALAGPRYPDAPTDRERIIAWERAVSVAPDRSETWHALGEALLHGGALLGMRDWTERSRAAFEHASVLDPDYASPVQYLVQLAALRGDTSAVRRDAARYARLDDSGELAAFVRWRAAQALGDSGTIADVRRSFGTTSSASLRSIALSALSNAVNGHDAEDVIRVLRARAARGTERADLLEAEHAIALARRHIARAMELTHDLDDVRPLSRTGDRMRMLDALYDHGDTASAAASAARLSGDTLTRDRADVACVAAQWRAWHSPAMIGSKAANVRPIDGLAADTTCQALVHAIAASRTGSVDSARLIAHFDSLLTYGPVSPGLVEYAHIPLARLYVSVGDAPRALAAIRRRPYLRAWPQYLTTALGAEGRLAEAAGDRSGAAHAYEQMLALVRGADARLDPDLQHAREWLAAQHGGQ